MIYRRKLSPLERYWLVLDEIYPCQATGVIEGVGQIDPVQLQQAVNRAAKANPAIRVRLRGFLGFCHWVDSGVAPRVRQMPLSAWRGDSEEHAPFLLERFYALRGKPIADVLIVPCTDGKIRLVFRTLHAAIDGRGLVLWIDDVMRAMRGEVLLGSASRLIDLDIQARYKDQIVDEPPVPPTKCIAVVPHGTPPAEPRYIWRRALLDRSVSQLLPKAAVFLAEWARRHKAGDVGFTIPIDYRGFRTEECGLGNLIGYLRLPVPEDATPRSVMQQLASRMRGFADCKEVGGIRALTWVRIRRIAEKMAPSVKTVLYSESNAVPTGGIVSMAINRLAGMSCPGYKATGMFGLPAAVGKLNVVITPFEDAMCVIFTAPSAYNDQGQLDAMVTAFERHFCRAEQQVA
jgi:hypothetical protein